MFGYSFSLHFKNDFLSMVTFYSEIVNWWQYWFFLIWNSIIPLYHEMSMKSSLCSNYRFSNLLEKSLFNSEHLMYSGPRHDNLKQMWRD